MGAIVEREEAYRVEFTCDTDNEDVLCDEIITGPVVAGWEGQGALYDKAIAAARLEGWIIKEVRRFLDYECTCPTCQEEGET